MTQCWVRFKYADAIQFGTLSDGNIRVCTGDMFDDPVPSDYVLRLSDVEPLYLVKTPNSYLGPNQTIRKPRCEGKVAFEGELAIVIGKTCSGVSEAQAMDHVFGYTCANDVTVSDILNRDPSFAQWVRAKSFDTFCPFGPVVATGLDPASLFVNTILNGELRQDYPISDMLFSVAQLVSLISQDMTLYPGDLILCGTSVGVGSMKPGSTIEVEIAGIGKLTNRFE